MKNRMPEQFAIPHTTEQFHTQQLVGIVKFSTLYVSAYTHAYDIQCLEDGDNNRC